MKESCQLCISLISKLFLQLKLKDEQFKVYKPSTHDKIDQLFANVQLNETLKSDDAMIDLSNRPVMAQYLKHCTWDCTYFVPFKNVAATFYPLVQLTIISSSLISLQLTPQRKPCHCYRHWQIMKIPFNLVKQHGSNIGLTGDCV